MTLSDYTRYARQVAFFEFAIDYATTDCWTEEVLRPDFEAGISYLRAATIRVREMDKSVSGMIAESLDVPETLR